ncbi:MAG TPA: arginine--tRNA ligase [Opitutales bacterium]|jgi:arginyl-tRNA synthetase|nr:arginine--tRNA ligase [Opitutales bacterium]
MDIWFHPARELDRIVRAAAARTSGFDGDFSPEIRAADPRHADFQANGVLGFAKARKANPRALGAALAETLSADPALDKTLVEVAVAGPGFINFKFTSAFFLAWLRRYRDEAAFREGAGNLYRGHRLVADYPSPNVAKQMHVGHLRPMVIGEAISRLLAFCGGQVIRDNHLGDWGTNFGVLILELKESGEKITSEPEAALVQLERLYKAGSAKAVDKNSAWAEAARQELVKLQTGDAENTRIWQHIVDVSNSAAKQVYQLLGVTIEHTLGESFYRDKVDKIYRELEECGLGTISEGALVVFHPEHPRFKEQPFIIRKSDGASNYASTDLATVLYRVEIWKADEIIYFTDGRQRDHFEQLFLTVAKWFRATGRAVPKMRHVWWGTILGEDGRAIKTKSGESLKLLEVLAEAQKRAHAIVAEKNPDLPVTEKEHIARVVGLGAVKYADLRQDRTSDYEFAWDKLLALDGNTAPYLLYAVARIHSIFRKAELPIDDLAREATADALATPTEIALARKLAALPTVLEATLADLRPHFLCTYLHELAGEFSTFYNADRVMVDEPAMKARRLLLCARTLRVLEAGLHTLGLETLERM